MKKILLITTYILYLAFPGISFAGNSFRDDFTYGDTLDPSVWNEIENGNNVTIGLSSLLSITGQGNTYHNNVLETDATFAREDNFTIEVAIRASANNTVVGGFGWGDKTWVTTPATSSGYFFQFQQDGNFRLVSKVAPDVHSVVLTTVPYVANRWYRVIMTVDSNGAVFEVYQDTNADRDFLDVGEDVDMLIDGLNSVTGSAFDNKPIIIYGVATGTTTLTDYIDVTANPFNGPTSLDAEGFYQKALVDWSAPVESLTVTDYQIEYSLAGQNSWSVFNDGVSTNTYAVVTGLSNSTAYDFRVAALRTAVVSEYTTPIVSATTLASEIPSTIYHIPQTGQSLSIGSMGTPALTTTQPYNNLSLDGEIFKDLIEGAGYSGFGLDDKGDVETNSSAMANTLTSLSGNGFLSLVTRHGKGGAEYDVIKQGTIYYNNLLDTVTKAKAAATLLGKTHIVPAVTLVHGESDQNLGASAATYQGYLEELQADLNTDIKAITGQTEDVILVTDQMSSLTTAVVNLGQLEASEANAGSIVLVTPKYIFDYVDNYHLDSESYRMLGEYYGKVFKKILVDEEPWLPLSPKNVVRNGTNIYASFNIPEPPLAIDTTWVSAKTNYGFEFAQTGGNSPSISAVSIIPDYNDIQITLNTAPTGTSPKLRYAYTGAFDTPGRLQATSQKGNIRDSDSTASLYGNDLYNWLVHFNENIVTDTTSPIISSVTDSSVSNTSQTIQVIANEDVTFTMDYGPRPLLAGQYSTSTVTNRLSTNSVTLTGLIPCARYYYRVTVSDLARNTANSSVNSFVTTGCIGSAAIEDQGDAFIATAGGGPHTLVGGLSNLSLDVPAGFAGADSIFQIKRLNKASVVGAIGLPSGKTAIGQHIYDLKALSGPTTSVTTFLQPIEVSITYDEADISGLDESTLSIFRYNGSAWVELSSCTVDTVLNTATCTTSNFSGFGLFGDPAVDITAPTVTITAPTKTYGATITDTTIEVTDDLGVLVADVSVGAGTTAGTSSLSCAQTSATEVDCTISVTSSGNLIIEAVDSNANLGSDTETSYVIDTVDPVVTINAPTTSSNATITDTTIEITDAVGVLVADVAVGAGTSAGTANLSCAQTSATEVDCTISITSSGNLVIDAEDSVGNIGTDTQTGYVISSATVVSGNTSSGSTSRARRAQNDAQNNINPSLNPVRESGETCGSAVSGKTLLRQNSAGAMVKKLQLQLMAAGYDVGIVDGIFGLKTLNGVRGFQAKSGLAVDGIVGAMTGAKLSFCGESLGPILGANDMSVKTTNSCDFNPAKKGDNGENVKKIQGFLVKQGFMTTTPDGIFGPVTENATKKFQLSYRKEILDPEGIIDATGLFYSATIKKAVELCES